MNKIASVLITGANAGLGFETARQLAAEKGVEKIILAVRNDQKGQRAKAELEALTGHRKFEVLRMDVADLGSVRRAVEQLGSPVDALVLNAGGIGGNRPDDLTADGVTNLFAVNVLGHALLVELLLNRGLLGSTVIYAGSEAARGVPRMGIDRPDFGHFSTETLIGVANGSGFPVKTDPMLKYGSVKLLAALWMRSMAARFPTVRFVTMSPGGTTGTNGMDDLPFMKRIMFKHVGSVLMPLFGMMHSVETGAKRFVAALSDPQYRSGHFYASGLSAPTGAVVDQETLFSDLFGPAETHDNAYQALQALLAEPNAATSRMTREAA